MARARNIKPAFFDNDELAEIPALGRLLFIGLWTLSDFKGDLEWREKRIKAQLLPYDNCDIKKLAINLDKSGFIRFYSDGDKIYLNICNFAKHQNPHKNEREKGSDIPVYSDHLREAIDIAGLAINHDKSGLKRNGSDSNRADSLNLIPDSLSLIPDSGKQEENLSSPPKAAKFSQDDFNCAEWFYSLLLKLNPAHKKPNLNAWADDIRKIVNIDNRSYNEISDLMLWVNQDPFWSTNILSPKKLREKWDQLIIQRTRKPANKTEARTINNLSVGEDFLNEH